MITNEMLTQLEEYAEFEGTEWGEAIVALLQCHGRRDMVSEKFLKALEKEMKEFYDYGQEHCKIVERSETYTHTVKEVEWNE